LGFELWAVGFGLWAVGCGLWFLSVGLWALGVGLWVLGSGAFEKHIQTTLVNLLRGLTWVKGMGPGRSRKIRGRSEEDQRKIRS
jgi:hypothetical protein